MGKANVCVSGTGVLVGAFPCAAGVDRVMLPQNIGVTFERKEFGGPDPTPTYPTDRHYIAGDISEGQVVVGKGIDGNRIGIILDAQQGRQIVGIFESRYRDLLIWEMSDSEATQFLLDSITPLGLTREPLVVSHGLPVGPFSTETAEGLRRLMDVLQNELNRIAAAQGWRYADGFWIA